MSESNLIINNRELSYRGKFSITELFQTINRSLEDRKYEKSEKKNEETVVEEGKTTYLELRPFKQKTDYVTLMIKIRVILDNIVEVVSEKDFKSQASKGKIEIDKEESLDYFSGKSVLQKGEVKIIFDSWLLTDYEHRWIMKPVVYFLRGIFDKYIYHINIERKFVDELVQDTAYIYTQIKKTLSLYSKSAAKVDEETVRQQISEEIVNEKGYY